MKQLTRILSVFLTANLLAILALGVQPISRARAESSTYTVNILGDPGDGTCDSGSCTLRDAILAANLNVGADTIVFSESGTITLGSALPTVSEDLTIDGRGQTVVISGGNLYQVLIINSGKTVTLDTLTIQNGKSGTHRWWNLQQWYANDKEIVHSLAIRHSLAGASSIAAR